MWITSQELRTLNKYCYEVQTFNTWKVLVAFRCMLSNSYIRIGIHTHLIQINVSTTVLNNW